MTVRQAAERWLNGIDDGTVRTRSGDTYKPSTRRSYRQSLDLHVLPAIGGVRLSELSRHDVQALVDRLHASGLDASTVRNAVMPLRALCRWAIRRGVIAVNVTTGLELPAPRGGRDRVATPEEALRLLDALPDADKAIWATALYAGLRLGELRALRWQDVDLDAGTIRVERSWDPREGPVAPKSRAGRRSVPIAKQLRRHLAAHRLRSSDDDLVFARTPGRPFNSSGLAARADTAWRNAGLPRITLHEARHTAASLMIAAGVDLKAISVFLGHSSITTTIDRYGHLLPGADRDARTRLDAFLAGPRVDAWPR